MFSTAGEFLHTHNLAELAALAALALLASFATQVVSKRYRPSPRLGQAAGLTVLAFGLLALVLAAPLSSFALLVAGALLAGIGHGLGFLNAQEELNDLAPERHRGEVISGFIACIYFLVASAVIATGVLDLWLSLSVAVGAVSLVLLALALATAGWQMTER